jgi:hypothetical protein
MVNRALIGSPLAAVRLGQGRESREVRRGGQAGFLGPWRGIPQPHAWPLAIGELHAGRFEGALSTSADAIGDSGMACLQPLYGQWGHSNLFGKIGLRPSD